MRHNRSQTNQRRSHHALKALPLSVCSKCSSPVRRHAMCANCGQYKGRVVVDVYSKIAKKEKKAKEKKA